MNGQLIVFSYFCRKLCCTRQKWKQASFALRLSLFLQKICCTRQSGSKLFTLVGAFVDN